MRFILNKMVVFDEEQGMLEEVNQEEAGKTLSLTEIRLIGFFVNNPNVVVSRETLLIEVWEKNDLTPSLNNLNNYMSMVRRKLARLGLPDVIITIPRSGFCLKIDSIETIEEEVPATTESFKNEFEISTQPENHSKTGISALRIRPGYKTTFALLLFVATLITASYEVYFHIENTGKMIKNDITFHKKIDNSDVYFLQGSLIELETGTVEEDAIIKKIASSKYKNPVVYVYINKRSTNKSEQGHFIYALCGNSKNEQCETTYTYNSKVL
ncbi:MAG: winged helix-turn-helix domain-containing protein [Serratia sp. (in: enterobacteria)]|uniref:winged helix-turn-helix domain-containing protein n=1 Tax=Serratia sp. (in: enterobacteria) TaxID=616 RepID=UPI003F39F1F3